MGNEHSATLITHLLQTSAYSHPTESIQIIETHISWIVLTGRYAYKIKKPVDFGFADFSTLARRRFFCEEELRLNRRFAPELYVSVEPIIGPPEQPVIGGAGDPIEYAVKMRQFDQRDLFLSLLATGTLGTSQIDGLAEATAAIHLGIERAAPDQNLGSVQAVRAAMSENFRHLVATVADDHDRVRLSRLQEWSECQLSRLAPTIEKRRRQGFVRECHGDLHLGNLVWIGRRSFPFDCIEFNRALRWIDIVSEIAFLGMDLEVHGARPLAYRFLNRYEAKIGDYAGLQLWDYFRLYRAMVRAKVNRLSITQTTRPEQLATLRQAYGSYLDFAERLLEPSKPYLFITHGLSGTGKSYVAEALAARWPAIWLRSDLERKRLCPQDHHERRYTEEITRATYSRLRDLASTLIGAGLSVIVDATFLQRWQRDEQRALAQEVGARFAIIDVQAPLQLIEQRIAERAQQQTEPSEATIEVMHAQRALREELTEHERTQTFTVDSLDSSLEWLLGRLAS